MEKAERGFKLGCLPPEPTLFLINSGTLMGKLKVWKCKRWAPLGLSQFQGPSFPAPRGRGTPGGKMRQDSPTHSSEREPAVATSAQL